MHPLLTNPWLVLGEVLNLGGVLSVKVLLVICKFVIKSSMEAIICPALISRKIVVTIVLLCCLGDVKELGF